MLSKSVFRFFSVILIQAIFFSFVFVPKVKAQESSSIIINPINNLSEDFIRGMDVSMLSQIEKSGGKFYDNGEQKDCLQILKDHGVNWIRLRIWNDPKDENGIDVGGGNCDLQMAIDISKRAKALGMKVLIDFHYSDFWADPGKQTKPKAWVNLSYEQLKQAVYDFTANAISSLNANGATPDMVQIGNELNNGFLWPDGQISGNSAGGYDKFAELLKQGIKAVKDNDPNLSDPNKRIKIMIHLANGGTNSLYRTVFDNLTQRGVDFDVIGLSFYPFWHGTLKDLQVNINDISERYNKEIAIAETSYAWTLSDGDGFENSFGEDEENFGGYKATIQGQASAIRDIMEVVSKVPNNKGLGIFYWEGDWIPVNGAGWKTGEGNSWDNQALFDFNGNALPSLDVFNKIYSNNPPTPLTIEEILPSKVTTPLGEIPTLPSTVKVIFNDHSIKEANVTWEDYDKNLLEQLGEFNIKGQVEGTIIQAICKITVSGHKNYVKNAGFETGNFDNWEATVLSGPQNAVRVEYSPGNNAHSGNYTMHYWAATAFKFIVSQTITGLNNGVYSLSVYTHGGGRENQLKLIASDYGGEELSTSTIHTGWREFKKVVINGIKVTNGQCKISILVDGNSNNWGSWDDVVFTEDTSYASIKSLQSVNANGDFNATIGVYDLNEDATAADIEINYSANLYDLIEVQNIDQDTQIIDIEKTQSGVRVFAINKKGLNNKDIITLKFKAKNLTEDKVGSFVINKFELGIAQDGRVIVPAQLSSINIKVNGIKQTGNQNNNTNNQTTNTNNTNNTSNQTTAIQNTQQNDQSNETTEKTYKVNIGNNNKNIVMEITPEKQQESYNVIIEQRIIEELQNKLNNKENISIKLNNSKDIKDINIQIPKVNLDKNKIGNKIVIDTPTLIINLPSDTFIDQSNNIRITNIGIKKEEALNISDSIKKQLFENEIYNIEFKNETNKISQFDKAITITIPLEKQDTDSQYLTILSISDDGKMEIIPNAIYNKENQSVTFKTHHFSKFAIIKRYKTFEDIKNIEWAKQAIEVLCSKGIIDNYDNDKFLPDNLITRSEFVSMLVKAFGFYSNFEGNFVDVDKDNNYYDYIGIAKKIGLINGIGNNKFNPNAPIKREDIAVLIKRAVEIEKEMSLKSNKALLNSYKDNNKVSKYASDAISLLIEKNIMTGNKAQIMPDSLATRKEAAVILYRTIMNLR
ncbi:glycosyl hydrolase 53 family protein [Caldicellulosiruptoraceae bacterium PP1]